MFNVRKKIIERAIHHTRRSVAFPDLQTVKTVGYVFQGEPEEQESFWAKAGLAPTIHYLSFIEGKRGDDLRSEVIYRSDLNFWKLPPDKLVHSFVDTPFDLLINLAGSANDALTYICAASKAKFKIGYAPLDGLFDLVVELDEQHKYKLSEEVIKTLRNLKRKE